MPAVRCPKCQKSLKAPDSMIGRRATCPNCKSPFVVPAPTAASAKTAPAPESTPAAVPGFPRKWLLAGGGGLAVLIAIVAVTAFPRAEPPSGPVTWKSIEPPEEVKLQPEPPRKITPTPVVQPKPEPPKVEPPKVDIPKKPRPAVASMEGMVDRLNRLRTAAGLKAVVVDSDLSRGCQAHADYIARNLDHPKLATAAGVQDEDPSLPGFTDHGKAAAAVSLIAFADPELGLDLWMGRWNSRTPLLFPDLERIGVGEAKTPDGQAVFILDPTRGHARPAVAYPAPGQKDVPLSFSGGPENDGPAAGFPVTFQFAATVKLADIDARLADDRGNRIACFLSTPDQPLPGVRRPGLVGLIPKKPLAPKSPYNVRIAGTVDGRPFERTWEFVTETDGDDDVVLANQLLDQLNRIRRKADLAPVELDETLSRGCRLHAKYLAINARQPQVQGLGAHQEDPSLPGFTPEGQKAGKAADIAIGDDRPLDALGGWMATLYHRVPLLEPNLKRIGFGCCRGEGLGWVTVVDVASGRDNAPRPGPVYYPVDGEADVPLHFPPGGETPNPIPNDTTGRAGYPITAFFPGPSPLLKSSMTLTDAKGADVPGWFSTPESPANPKFPVHQGTTVCFIPKSPLRPGETYRVALTGTRTGDGFKKTWTFTTAKEVAGDAAAVAAVARLNHFRKAAGLPEVSLDPGLSRGCQAHAEYLVRNANHREDKDFSLIDESAKFPGFTAHGRESAQRADVFVHAPRTTTQIDDLMGTVYRRTFALDPRLRRVGLGCVHESGRGWVNVLDLNTGRDDGDPVVFPAPSQDDVPTAGRDRLPGAKEFAGFPITVWFPGRPKITNVNATLADAAGSPIDAYLSSPTAPFQRDAPQTNVIALHPRSPLRSGQTYSVRFSAEVDGAAWQKQWRFATGEK